MAFDKVVDSAALEAGLTQIATAIREKGGTTDVLAFPDAMAAAITAIQAGGEYIIEHGTRTFTEDTFPYTTPVIIEHGLGKRPLFFFGVSGTEGLYKQNAITYIVAVYKGFSGIHPVRGASGFSCYAPNAGSTSMSVIGGAAGEYVSMDATKVTISASSSSYGFFFYSGNNEPAVINWWAVASK